jgi:hypothetical protein
MQLYTFLETTLVSVSLLPHFIAFFSDVDDEGSLPGNLATTFLGFGKFAETNLVLVFLPVGVVFA